MLQPSRAAIATLEGCSISPPLPCPPGIFRTQHLLFFFGLVDQSNLVPQASHLAVQMQLVRGYP